jgi:4-amino-4-deoxy-L-arabinose transferase-like glycosyltransferase
LWPASSRPYIGGSQENSILELTLGYNGLGRLTGDEVGSVGGGNAGGAGGGMWGATGLGRLLDSENGGQIGWLLPTALLLLVGGLWLTRRAPRTDRTRAGLVLWGGWLLVTAATFSFMAGIFHAYYSVALAPAIAAVVGTGAWLLWRHRASLLAGFLSTTAVALTTVLSFYLLGRTPDFLPWLRWTVLAVGLAAALLVAGLSLLPRRVAAAVAAVALLASLAGPAAYAVETAATPHSGSIPTAGPSGAGGFGGGPGGAPGGGQQLPTGTPPGGTTTGGPGGAGGLLNGSESSAELTALLQADADSYTWVAAAVGSNSAAGYQLASEEPVMAIGGFNGSDPSPTLAEFQAYVADGEIHYFIGGGGFGQQRGGSESSSEIAAWVAANFATVTVDGTTVYDLTQPLSAGATTGSTTGSAT